MRLLALVLTLLLADFAVAFAQTATPDTEMAAIAYILWPVVCCVSTPAPAKSRSAAGAMSAGCARWCPTNARCWRIARLQGENATLKKELLARGLPVPGALGPSVAKPDEPELKLPSDTEVDKVISFLDKVWRRLVEMGRSLQKEIERKN